MSDNLPVPAATAVKAIAGALARQACTALGVALVSHGIMDQSQADALTSPLADAAIGVVLTGVSLGWSTIRVMITHSRYANAWSVMTGEKEVKSEVTPAA